MRKTLILLVLLYPTDLYFNTSRNSCKFYHAITRLIVCDCHYPARCMFRQYCHHKRCWHKSKKYKLTATNCKLHTACMMRYCPSYESTASLPTKVRRRQQQTSHNPNHNLTYWRCYILHYLLTYPTTSMQTACKLSHCWSVVAPGLTLCAAAANCTRWVLRVDRVFLLYSLNTLPIQHIACFNYGSDDADAVMTSLLRVHEGRQLGPLWTGKIARTTN